MKKFELYYPVRPILVSQNFGETANIKYYQDNGIPIVKHNGIDFVVPHATPVYASHAGTCYPSVDDKGGNGVVIRTDEDYDYNGVPTRFKTIYWHLIDDDAVVKTGQKVAAGDLIGYADSTGLSTGDHLHYGLKPQRWDENDWIWYNVEFDNGIMGAIDPNPYFNGYFASDAKTVMGVLTKLIDALTELIAKYAK